MWLGEAGAGTRLKIAVNAWIVSVVEGAAETLALAEGLGLDPSLVLEAVAGGPLDLPYLQMKGKAMIARDVRARRSGSRSPPRTPRSSPTPRPRPGLDLPLVEAIRARLAEGFEEHGDKDMSATFLTSSPALPDDEARPGDACSAPSADALQARVGLLLAADLRARPAVDAHDVGREVVLARAAARRRPRRRRPARRPPRRPRSSSASKPPETTIRIAPWPAASRPARTRRASSMLTPRGASSPRSASAAVDDRLRRVQAHAPQVAAERVGDGDGGRQRVVVEVDEHRDVHLARVAARRTRAPPRPCRRA